jgi:GNAT superfamily N-acetyltransferase
MGRRISGKGFTESAGYCMHVIDSRQKAFECEEFFRQLPNLYRQLTDNMLSGHLIELVNTYTNFVFITQSTNLVASATLVTVRTPTSCKGLIEEVVIDERHRRCGLGTALLEAAIRLGQEKGCRSFMLTSKSDREGTSAFYAMAGFEIAARANRDHPQATNLYRADVRRHRC